MTVIASCQLRLKTMTATKMKRPKVTTRLSRLWLRNWRLVSTSTVTRDMSWPVCDWSWKEKLRRLDAVVEVVAQVVGNVLGEVFAHVALAVGEDAPEGVEQDDEEGGDQEGVLIAGRDAVVDAVAEGQGLEVVGGEGAEGNGEGEGSRPSSAGANS